MSGSRSEILFVHDILDSVARIEQYVAQIDYEDFLTNVEKQDAIIRRLEINGEASKQISPDLKTQFSSIPWREMAGLRDIAIHGYFKIDPQIIWNSAKLNLPALLPERIRLQ